MHEFSMRFEIVILMNFIQQIKLLPKTHFKAHIAYSNNDTYVNSATQPFFNNFYQRRNWYYRFVAFDF